jgi:1-acyl-sn-glycerol-3-phosphate acyltransferase
LPSDFYLRKWGRAGMRKRAEEVDEFGLDPAYEAKFRPFFDFLYKTYFRVEAEGTEHIPSEGPCLIVSNHSGGPLPYDGVMLRTTVRREHEAARELRWLAEDFIYYLPFVGTAMNRLGAVRACQENAERLLASGNLVAVFPEGAKGIGKLFRERYKLQRFGRGGFIRLCLRTETPIIPCAIVGAEEANPMLYRIEYMAKTLGIPYLPITPTFPALGPIGLLPAPTKWKVTFGEPIHFESYGPEAADDELLVGRLAERVRATIQAMLDRTLAGRRSVWFG